MISDLDQLQSWTTELEIRRADRAQQDYGAMPWTVGAAGGDVAADCPELAQTTSIHGADPVTDEWQELVINGFLQDPTTKEFRLMPITVYPGIVLAPWVENATVPPPSSVLWVTITWQTGSATFPNRAGPQWDGSIQSATAVMFWAPAGQEYTDGNARSPTQVFFNGRIGSTDAGGLFTLDDSEVQFTDTCGQIAPLLSFLA